METVYECIRELESRSAGAAVQKRPYGPCRRVSHRPTPEAQKLCALTRVQVKNIGDIGVLRCHGMLHCGHHHQVLFVGVRQSRTP